MPPVAMQARPATVADAPGIVRVLRESIPSAVIKNGIYGCRGIERYVAALIAMPAAVAETRYTVIGAGGGVVGCAVVARRPGVVFLNYIAVRSDFRAHHLGRRLLLAAIDSIGGDGNSELRLDVMETNPVSGWYYALGLRSAGTTGWWHIDAGRAAGDEVAVVAGQPQADACHREFGFSELTLHGHLRSVSVGRLGDALFRLTDPGALADASIVHALRLLDPKRSLLAIGELHALSPLVEEPCLLRMTRMVGPVYVVRARLAEQLK